VVAGSELVEIPQPEPTRTRGVARPVAPPRARPGPRGASRGPAGEPPLVSSALLSSVLLVAALAAGDLLGSGTGAFVPAAAVGRYVTDRPDAVLAADELVLAAAIPLTVFTGILGERLRTLGHTGRGTALGYGSAAAAVVLTAISALLLWVLAHPETVSRPGIARYLHDLSFAAGGVGFSLFLAVVVAAVAGPARGTGTLPRPAYLTGLLLAALAAAAPLVIVWSPLATLLAGTRFGCLVWLIYAGLRLPVRRATLPSRPAARPAPPAPHGRSRRAWRTRAAGASSRSTVR
jgi:hypothetical protein